VSTVGAVWQLAALLVGSGFLLTVARGQMASLFMLATRGGLSLGNLVTGTFIGLSLSSVHHAFLINGLLAVGVQIFVVWRLFQKQAKAC